jgi:hypothetical protein
MGVAADDQVGIRAGGDAGERRVGLVLVEVLVHPPGAAVDEEEPMAFRLEPDLRRERPQPRFVRVARVGLRPGEALVAERLLDRVGVGAAALVAVEACPVVVVAHDDRDPFHPEAFEHLVGPGRVADEIAEDVPGVDAGRVDVGEDRVEGR